MEDTRHDWDDQPSATTPIRAAFGRELAHWRTLQGKTQASLARRLVEERWLEECGQSYVAHVEAGRKAPPRGMAEGADAILGTGGALARLWLWIEREHGWIAHLTRERLGATIVARSEAEGLGGQEVSAVPTRRELLGYLGAGMAATAVDRMFSNPVVAALDANRHAGASSLAPGTVDDLAHTVEGFRHDYGHTSPAQLEPDLLATRRYVGWLLDRKLTLTEHRDLVVLAGWLSTLLGLASFDLGDHQAARIWCWDAQERGLEAAHGELAAFAHEPLVIMAFYRRQPAEAVAHARAGLAHAPAASTAAAKLTAQEMRATGALGDADRFTDARRRAERAVAKHDPGPEGPGTFRAVGGTTMALFTTTSLVALCDYAAAEVLARQLVEQNDVQVNPTGFALYRLELALALAGRGRLDEAAATGMEALASPRLVRSALARAADLDTTLSGKRAQVSEARDFHERYLAARRALVRPDAAS